ncbi:TIM-barrel fold metal-dependent hydrolase [Paramagnetospirillum caucaseum]|uniref:TIM-barrel fold metal-dependent hydrolase n=1 Tax=Paramagnetospirillum caucaseum TaxID=1244869 RepID=M3AAX9_9PROT|nr:amidohydrolase family protein [Paramagnetospirillum caucaseum]EME69963.1 TIM-barrel fold metal-dependent hydrolase [Paramagnetospirillum caucaseum]
MAIDFHCNLFTPEAIERHWYGQPEMYRLIKWWKMEERVKGVTVDDFVAMMDAAGLEKALIPAIRMMSYQKKTMVWDITEEEVHAAVSRHPDRLVGLCGFNPLQKLDSVRNVERAVKDYGFKGVYIHTYGFGIPLDHRLYYPLYAKCVELGIPVSMQVGHSAEHMPNELGRPIHLDNIALDFPELKLIGAHTGWPWTEEMISLAWKHENVYLGIDAHNPKYLEPTLVHFMKTRGQNKVIYGTNYPAITHAESIASIRNELGLTEKVADKILRGNAARVYGL